MTENGRFRREVLPHLDHLHSVARSMIHDRANTGDLVLQTLMKARDRYHSEQPDEDVRSWLTRIMSQLWLDRFQSDPRNDVRPASGRGKQMTGRTGDEQWIEQVQFDDVREALMRMPDLHRRLLVLSMSDQLDIHQVAEQQNTTPERVRCQFQRAKQLLKQALSSS